MSCLKFYKFLLPTYVCFSNRSSYVIFAISSILKLQITIKLWCFYRPGVVRRNRFSALPSEALEQVYKNLAVKYPAGRVGEGVDLANAVAYLASDQASFITGTLMVVDGGHIAGNVNIEFE